MAAIKLFFIAILTTACSANGVITWSSAGNNFPNNFNTHGFQWQNTFPKIQLPKIIIPPIIIPPMPPMPTIPPIIIPPIPPIPTIPPIVIPKIKPIDLANVNIGPGQSFSGIAINSQSSSGIQDGKVIRSGSTTIMMNDNGVIKTYQINEPSGNIVETTTTTETS